MPLLLYQRRSYRKIPAVDIVDENGDEQQKQRRRKASEGRAVFSLVAQGIRLRDSHSSSCLLASCYLTRVSFTPPPLHRSAMRWISNKLAPRARRRRSTRT